MTALPRLALLGAVAALVVAGCGSSATPAPSTSAAAPSSPAADGGASASAGAASLAPTPAPTASAAASATAGAGATACGMDISSISKTMRTVDHYTATGTMVMLVNMPVGSAEASPSPLTAQITMIRKAPDRDRFDTKMSIGGVDYATTTIRVGTDQWTDRDGSGSYQHSTVDAKTADDSDLYASLTAAGLQLVDPAGLSGIPDLPGSGCIVAFGAAATPTASPATGGFDMSAVKHIFFRVKPDGRVESTAFVFDPAQAATGSVPTTLSLTYDYEKPVSIEPPAASTGVVPSAAP